MAMRCVTDDLNIILESLKDITILAHNQTALFVKLIQIPCECIYTKRPFFPQNIKIGIPSVDFEMSPLMYQLPTWKSFFGIRSIQALFFADLSDAKRDVLWSELLKSVVGLYTGVKDINKYIVNNNYMIN